MKRSPRFVSAVLIAALCCSLFILPAAADNVDKTSDAAAWLSYNAGTGTEHTAIVDVQNINGEYCLFLPSSADLDRLALSFSGEEAKVSAGGSSLSIKSGEAFDFASLFAETPTDGKYKAKFIIEGSTYDVCIMRSGAVRSLYITSADPEKGHDYVDAVKGNKAKGNEIVLLGAEGDTVYDGVIKEIKGRGNSTWNYPKKPYQFKLNEKADLLGKGDAEKSKTWILLANYFDNSLFRNSLTNDLAAAIGLNYAHNCEFVDLYYDGEYCGSYLLSEKTEIDSARIDINDLEGEIEDVNVDVEDFDDLAAVIIENSMGNPMQVTEGLALPEDISGGYLLEMDYEERAKAEKSWFKTGNGAYIVCKSPEYLPEEAMEYISGIFRDFEDAVYNGGIHPETGASYTEYVDLESLAKSYLLLTLAQNGDAFLSSTYFYIPQNEAKLYAGPVWDFDSAYGLYSDSEYQGFTPARAKLAMKLLQIDSFREAVANEWNTCLKAVVEEIVLSRDEVSGLGVGSLASYAAECSQSRMMDVVRWGHTESYADSVEAMYSFMAESCSWVNDVLTNPETRWSESCFADVDANSWYNDAVVYTSKKAWFTGVSDVLFLPDGRMTRAMLVTVLYRIAGSPDVSGSCSYTDVAVDSSYRSAIIWAESAGITTGYGDGRFGLSDPVTREQLVVFLHRFAQYAGKVTYEAEISDEYVDKAEVSFWAAEAFGWAISEGIINGVSDLVPTLDPRGGSTRAMAATIIYRYDNSILNS